MSGWSLVNRNPIYCGVSECDREASTMSRPWPNGGYCAMGETHGDKKKKVAYNDQSFE